MGKIAGFNTMASLAANRVRLLMQQTDMDRPADLIADILHYCREEGICFGNELSTAEAYVTEEETFDDQDNYSGVQ